MKSSDPKISEPAKLAALIMSTGIRPGSESDTGAKVKAYGATTLEGRHVVTDSEGNTRLQFVGKKGVNIDYTRERQRSREYASAEEIRAGRKTVQRL